MDPLVQTLSTINDDVRDDRSSLIIGKSLNDPPRTVDPGCRSTVGRNKNGAPSGDRDKL